MAINSSIVPGPDAAQGIGRVGKYTKQAAMRLRLINMRKVRKPLRRRK